MMAPIIFLVCWWFLWLSPLRIMQGWKRIFSIIAMTVLLLYAGIATLGVYYDQSYPWCMVTQETKLFIGPDSSYAVRGIVASGTKVRRIGEYGTWRKIQQDSLVGWIAADYMNE